MKTYSEFVTHLSNQAFGRYMGGSYNEWGNVDFGQIAFLFDKPRGEVEQDCERTLEEIKTHYYNHRAEKVT